MEKIRNPFYAALLSAFIPGTGQVYNQEPGKGWVIFISFLLLIITVIGAPCVWIYGVIDAYRTAGKINRKEKKLYIERSPVKAFLNSFLCGWGQIYNGQILKGFSMAISFVLVFLITGTALAVMIGTGLLPLLFMLLILPALILLFIWIYGFTDAFRTAKKINMGMEETDLIKSLINSSFSLLPEILEKKDERKELPSGYSEIIKKISLLSEEGNYGKALKETKKALAGSEKDNPMFHEELGKIYFSLENYGFSALEFIEAIRLNSTGGDIYSNLGAAILSYSQKSNNSSYLDEAEKCLKKARSLKENWQTDLNIINLLIIKGEREEAKRCCNELIEKKPDLWQAKHALALVLLEEKERKMAKELLESIIKDHPSAIESKIALARLFEEEKAEGQALSIYREILETEGREKFKEGVKKRIRTLTTPDRKFFRWLFRRNRII